MLIPITRETFEELVPRYATGEQYRYMSGKLPDFLRRLLISVVGVLVAFMLNAILPSGFEILEFVIGIVTGLYWLWSPVYWASLRNLKARRYPYSGFWRGRVVDAFPSEEVVGTEETVNPKGELVIVENRERRLNLEVADKQGFSTRIQVPLQRTHQMIRPGDRAEMLVMSNRPDLSYISMFSDVHLVDYDLWVSDYPYVRRDAFKDVSRRLTAELKPAPKPAPKSAPANKSKRRRSSSRR